MRLAREDASITDLHSSYDSYRPDRKHCWTCGGNEKKNFSKEMTHMLKDFFLQLFSHLLTNHPPWFMFITHTTGST